MEKVYGSIVLLVGGALLTLARRWKNEDTTAGYGIVGWTMFIILLIWLNDM